MPIRGHISTNAAYIAEVIRSFPPKKISDQGNTPTVQMTSSANGQTVQMASSANSQPTQQKACSGPEFNWCYSFKLSLASTPSVVCVSLCLSLCISLSLPYLEVQNHTEFCLGLSKFLHNLYRSLT